MTEEDRMHAAEYVIGSLNARERSVFEARLRTDSSLQREVNFWQARFSSLSTGLPPVTPSAETRARILNAAAQNQGAGAQSEGRIVSLAARRAEIDETRKAPDAPPVSGEVLPFARKKKQETNKPDWRWAAVAAALMCALIGYQFYGDARPGLTPAGGARIAQPAPAPTNNELAREASRNAQGQPCPPRNTTADGQSQSNKAPNIANASGERSGSITTAGASREQGRLVTGDQPAPTSDECK
jgi:anti-sigma-K factor RskA